MNEDSQSEKGEFSPKERKAKVPVKYRVYERVYKEVMKRRRTAVKAQGLLALTPMDAWGAMQHDPALRQALDDYCASLVDGVAMHSAVSLDALLFLIERADLARGYRKDDKSSQILDDGSIIDIKVFRQEGIKLVTEANPVTDDHDMSSDDSSVSWESLQDFSGDAG